jgi:hypothetical protein
MQTVKSLGEITICAVVAALAPLVHAQQKTSPPPKYYVINLGDPLGVPSAAAAGINNIGWIAGDALATANPDKIYFRWL